METARDVEHPVLVRDVMRSDGSHVTGFRVFCARQEQSVTLDACRRCPSCLGVSEGGLGGSGIVHCSVAVDTSERLRRKEALVSLDQGAAVGSVLAANVLCVRDDVGVHDVRALFIERGVPYVIVVNEGSVVVGLVREADLVRPRVLPGPYPSHPDPLRAQFLASLEAGAGVAETARDMMSAPTVVREDAPLRRALAQMAVAHVRDAPIVTASGVIVSVLRDVEGLRALARQFREEEGAAALRFALGP